MAPNSHSRAEWSWCSGPGLFAPRLGPAPPSLMWASRALTSPTSRTWPQDPGLSPTWAQVQGAQWAGCPARGPPSQGGRDSGPRWSPGVGGSRTLLWPFTWLAWMVGPACKGPSPRHPKCSTLHLEGPLWGMVPTGLPIHPGILGRPGPVPSGVWLPLVPE